MAVSSDSDQVSDSFEVTDSFLSEVNRNRVEGRKALASSSAKYRYDQFVFNVQSFSVGNTVSHYKDWLSNPTFLVWRGHDVVHSKTKFSYSLSPKRGSSMYARRVCRRWDVVSDSVPDLKFFKYGVHGNVSSSFLELTYTYSRCVVLEGGKWVPCKNGTPNSRLVPLPFAWQNVAFHINRSRSYLTKKYGKCSVARVWESHKDGFCHVHALFFFKDYSFKGFSHRNSKGKLEYLVNNHDRDAIAKSWKHGFIKVKLMSGSKSGFRYMKKYLTKSVKADDRDSKTVKTLALCWYFNKRAFSLSRDWQLGVHDLISCNSNSNFLDVLSDVSPFEYSLLGLNRGNHDLFKAEFGDLSRSDAHSLVLSPNFHRTS